VNYLEVQTSKKSSYNCIVHRMVPHYTVIAGTLKLVIDKNPGRFLTTATATFDGFNFNHLSKAQCVSPIRCLRCTPHVSLSACSTSCCPSTASCCSGDNFLNLQMHRTSPTVDDWSLKKPATQAQHAACLWLAVCLGQHVQADNGKRNRFISCRQASTSLER
jgi:hypothetical protein